MTSPSQLISNALSSIKLFFNSSISFSTPHQLQTFFDSLLLNKFSKMFFIFLMVYFIFSPFFSSFIQVLLRISWSLLSSFNYNFILVRASSNCQLYFFKLFLVSPLAFFFPFPFILRGALSKILSSSKPGNWFADFDSSFDSFLRGFVSYLGGSLTLISIPSDKN